MNKQPNDQTVVQSQAMVAPPVENMFQKRNYPRAEVPTVGHARLSGEPEAGRYTLTYCGYDIVSFKVDPQTQPKVRCHSDGNFQSDPFIQQFVISAREEGRAEARFTCPVEMINIRPRRARRGEAILGQVGRPLMPGVCGLYVPKWDLLLSVHGLPFAWQSDRIEEKEGAFEAGMTYTLGERPLVLQVRPRYYQRHLGYTSHEPWRFAPDPRPIAGWCSWEAYHSDIRQEHIRDAASTLAPLINYGLKYMQLDDGYQLSPQPPAAGSNYGDTWTHTNDKFEGHESIISAMREGGFVPGLWTNATVSNRAAAQEDGYCVLDANGEPLKGDWIQYVMTCTDEMLAEHVTPYYKKLREFGYEYLKSDSIRHLIFDGLQEAVRLGLMSDEDADKRQRAYMRAAREGLGEDCYYLSCWGVLSQSIGVCDAMRVATDANPHWYAFSMQLRETARWFFTQRVLFTLDPDHVCVRAELPWVRMMLSLVSLTGGLYMISDKPESYDDARIDLIRRTLPPLATRTAEVGPVDYSTPACYGVRESEDWARTAFAIAGLEESDDEAPFGSLWATHFALPGRRWCVVQRTALVPLRPYSAALEALSLPAGSYFAYDFWAQKPLGIAREVLELSGLGLGDCQVVALTDVSDGLPHIVGGDRHVSMDAVSVAGFEASKSSVEMALSGFDGLECRYVLYGAASLESIACEGGEAALIREGELSIVSVRFGGPAMTVKLTK